MDPVIHSKPTDVKAAAVEYIARGLQVVPLAEGTKACIEKDWLKLIFTPKDFKPSDNIGIRSVNGIVDIDCDSAEVIEMAEEFLPATGAIYGRLSKPHAHWLYHSVFEKRIAFLDHSVNEEKKGTLIEIRVNHQSMAPPSIHPEDKEVLEWQGGFGEISEIKTEPLLRSVQLLATAALTGRHYNPSGNRHDWCLALSGFFRQLGISHDECKRIVTQAGKWARDPKLHDRIAEVNSTYNHGDDDPLRAAGALKELMSKGPVFVKSLIHIWGPSSSAFFVDNKGSKIVANDQANIKLALKRLEAELSFDAFIQKAKVKYRSYDGPLEDVVANSIWLQIDRQFRFRPTVEFFDIVIRDLAASNPFHPVQDYLKNLKWDGQPRLDTWLVRHAKAADNKYVRAISSIVLLAAVRRVFQPGCKFDELLVLESDQGQLKSSALRTLCPNEDWFSDDLPLNVDAKQVIERTTGKWIIEAAELSGLGKAQTEHLKSMLSRQVDGPVRMAYARFPIEQRRQFIIIGTTNSHVYLQDPTGNRRFWPCRIERFDLEALRKERDQIWAEATVREHKGESIRLSTDLWDLAQIQQERRYIEDAWESILRTTFDAEIARVTPAQIWEALGIPIQYRTSSAQIRITQIMQKMGFIKGAVTDKETKKIVKGWQKGKWQRGVPLPLEGIPPDLDS